MKPVQVKQAVAAALVVLAISGVGWQLLVNAGHSIPKHSWWEVLLLLGLAVALLTAGSRIRGYVAALGRASREASATLRSGGDEAAATAAAEEAMHGQGAPAPTTARRVLVFAQAAALGGGVLVGWYLAQGLMQLRRFDVPAGRNDVILLVLLAAAGVGLSAAGFVVQRWCTIPEDQR